MRTLKVKTLILIVLISGIAVFFQNCSVMYPSGDSSSDNNIQSLGEQSLQLRKTYCAQCHDGPSALTEPKNILDDQKLIDGAWIVPGNPQNSPLYQSLFANMPLNGNKLNAKEIAVFSDWIKSLGEKDLLPANLEIKEGQGFDFSQVSTGQQMDAVFTLHNSGERAAQTITAAVNLPFQFKGGAFPGESGTCKDSLSRDESCQFVVTFAPSTSDVFTSELKIQYNDIDSAKAVSLNLSGRGQGASIAQLNFPPVSDEFGIVTVNTAKFVTYQLKNIGAATATNLSYSNLDQGFSIDANTCSTSLDVDATCNIVIKFFSSSVGVFNKSLTVTYNNGVETKDISLNLHATAAGGESQVGFAEVKEILINSCLSCHNDDFKDYSSLLAFKREGSTPAITPGDSNSRFIKRISGSVDGKTQMGTGSYGSLSADDRQTLIDWITDGAPESVGPTKIANLTISSQTGYNFGDVLIGNVSSQNFTITNNGDGSASATEFTGLASPFNFKGGTFPGVGGTCGTTLAAGKSCIVAISFAPTQLSNSSDSLLVNYNNGKENKSLSLNLTGKGIGVVKAILNFNPQDTLSFGYALTQKTVQKTLTLTNSGEANATAITVKTIFAPFKFKGGVYPGTGGTCSASLAKKASCNLILEFTPTVEGQFTKIFALEFNDSVSTKTLQISFIGNGQAASEPVYYTDLISGSGPLTKCLSCHGEFSSYSGLMNFKKSGETTSSLYGGLDSRFVKEITGRMSTASYGNLTPAEIQTLLAWVGGGTLEFKSGSITQEFSPNLGDRYYITAVFHKVFGLDKSVTDNTVKISSRADIFGTPCHRQNLSYDSNSRLVRNFPLKNDGCFVANSAETRSDALTVPISSTVSESIRLTTCFKVSDKDINVITALGKIGLNPGSDLNQANIAKLYKQFYPGSTMSVPATNSLVALGEKAPKSTSEAKYLEGWRFVLLTLCMSTGWQSP